MNVKHTQRLIAGVIATIALTAHAQSPGDSADELLQDANVVLRQLDAGQFDDVWTNAAGFVKTRVKQDQFATNLRRARQAFGTVDHRGWAQVTRIRYTNVANVPDGLYANVDCATTLTTGARFYEKLSFRLDGDDHWHLTGYTPRKTQDVQAGIPQY
ncbi:hypothetical protein C5615_38130 [Burkholderia cepacia]|uniref:DUF4019 domain-containing protein n=1 Tax=Burkholderia cepacia TaxID=292 RepID=A0A2S8HWV5_BURCE|nr:DUF4019 domain-containing protein [Burkholderia cepacia]PQP07064.1 hypothetical protein C5615_38130 [Burkholderia cepacia]HDR9512157.1 DUF4019 domain-containing protein [Burkholderia cepacia]